MLHLLPSLYVKEIQSEYRKRVFVVICHSLAFCLIVFILGCIPSFVTVTTEKDELERQNTVSTFRISDADRIFATNFESSVKRGISIINNPQSLSAADVSYLLELARDGIIIQGFSLNKEDSEVSIELQGIADTRTNLRNFIRVIDESGKYKVQNVPASTFTKDKDLFFNFILQ